MAFTDALSHVVAKFNNLDLNHTQQLNAEATIWTNVGEADKRTVIYASGGQYRDNCNYNLYFGAWRCMRPNEIFYMNIYVTDKSGAVVQRSFTGYCAISMLYFRKLAKFQENLRQRNMLINCRNNFWYFANFLEINFSSPSNRTTRRLFEWWLSIAT